MTAVNLGQGREGIAPLVANAASTCASDTAIIAGWGESSTSHGGGSCSIIGSGGEAKTVGQQGHEHPR